MAPAHAALPTTARPQRRAPHRTGTAALAALLFLTALLYLPLLPTGYLADDYSLLAPVAGGRWSFGERFPAGTGGYFRPLVMLTLLPGDRPVLQHAINLLLHLAATGMIHAAVRPLARPVTALAAAAVFAVHPAVVPTVAWISGRTESVCAVFYLAGMAAFLRYRESGRRGWMALAVVAVVPAALAKETGFTLPLAYALAAAWPAPEATTSSGTAPGGDGRRGAWMGVAGALACAGLLGLTGLGLGWWQAEGVGLPRRPFGAATPLLVTLNALVLRVPEFDLRKAAWAAGWGMAVAAAVGAALLVSLLPLLARRVDWRLRELCAAAVLPAVPLLPLMAIGWARERHAYLPLALALVSLAAVFGRRFGGRAMPIAAALVAVLALLAWQRIAVWRGNAELTERYCTSVRELAHRLEGLSTVALPVVPASRAGAPVLSNDSQQAFHHCLTGRFGSLAALRPHLAMELGPPELDFADALSVVRRDGALEIAATSSRAHFGRSSAPGESWSDAMMVTITPTSVDASGDVRSFVLRPAKGDEAVAVLLPTPAGFELVELAPAGAAAGRR